MLFIFQRFFNILYYLLNVFYMYDFIIVNTNSCIELSQMSNVEIDTFDVVHTVDCCGHIWNNHWNCCSVQTTEVE